MKTNLKSIAKSKKGKLLLTGAALLAMGVGTTYAWWTAESSDSFQETMGTMSIKTDFSSIKDAVGYEPGLTVDGYGTVENTGSIDTFFKINADTQIQFAENADGTVIPEESRKFEAIDPNAVKVTFAPRINENETDSFWFKDSAGNLYGLVHTGDTLTADVHEDFSGESIDNHYMNAAVTTKIQAEASQALDAAAQAQFGVDLGSLEVYEGPTAKSGESQQTMNAYKERAMKCLHEVMDR